jgi:hypothetical protein
MISRNLSLSVFVFTFGVIMPLAAGAQSLQMGAAQSPGSSIKLVQALMCEDIIESIPQNPTSVFSIERRKAVCFTSFDPVSETTVIYHNWFHKDRSSAKIKLTLKPPRWSTFSSIQFREEDIGPWKVEITDSEGRIFHVLRFSISE